MHQFRRSVYSLRGKGELLICLFDKTSLFANELSRRYLKSQNYAVLDGETVQKIRNVWIGSRSLPAVDEVITNMLGGTGFQYFCAAVSEYPAAVCTADVAGIGFDEKRIVSMGKNENRKDTARWMIGIVTGLASFSNF